MGAIGSVFSGIGKMFKSIFYILGGKSDRMGEIWAAHPDAIAGAYTDVIKQRKDRILRVREAVAGIQALHDQKQLKLKELIEEQENDTEVRDAIMEELKVYTSQKQGEGLTRQEIEADVRYIELMNHYSDISDTVDQRADRIDEIDADIKRSDGELEDYIAEIKDLNRDLEKLKKESQEAKADISLAKEEEALNDLKSGIASNDSSTEELRDLRNRVQKIKSSATVSKKLAGTDVSQERRKLVEKHRMSRKSRELSSLLFEADKADSASSATPEATKEDVKLPEA